MKKHIDNKESPTMREIHRIQDQLEQQYQKSGLPYLEWLQATEDDFQKSLTEDGFHIVTRNGETFIEEIKEPTKRNKLSLLKTAKHKNYDGYIEHSPKMELPLISEEKTLSGKVKQQSSPKNVKYQAAAKRRKTTSRKK